jgi:hypothetical protein
MNPFLDMNSKKGVHTDLCGHVGVNSGLRGYGIFALKTPLDGEGSSIDGCGFFLSPSGDLSQIDAR